MKFGDYLRQKRENHNWTQPEAAARIGIEQSYLSKLETGKSYPSEDIYGRLSSIYDMDVQEMTASVFSAELDRLREINDVRAAVLKRQQNETRFMRGWLVAGLIMIMIGGAAVGIANTVPESARTENLYRSEGIVRPGEPAVIFEMLRAGSTEETGTLSERIDYDDRVLSENRGPSFIENVDGGYRVYKLLGTTRKVEVSPVRWLLSPGIMFILGGIACFYISRRWR